jgi:amino acid adenylation domain-containing protein
MADAFEHRVDAQPDSIAIEAKEKGLRYRQLDCLANQLAHRLRSLGVSRDDVVTIAAERGLETIIAALGTWKAGAAYCPIDPENPHLRISQQIQTIRSKIAIAPPHLADCLIGTGIEVITLECAWQIMPDESSERPRHQAIASDLCAVIFTSGSTGAPKGVAIEHRNMLNLLCAESELLPRSGERTLQVCTPQFDVGVYETWATLIAGGRLVCYPPGRPEPRAVCATIKERKITWAAIATGIFHQLVDYSPEALASMRLILVGGEPLVPAYARRFRSTCPRTRIVNIYGPTETTVFVCAQEVDDEIAARQRIPVGTAVAGAHLCVLDEQGSRVPRGERGELWISGPGIARGYLHRPELTAERFKTDFATAVGYERLYRSGDMVRELSSGAIEILGRVDDQVKVHGYRVEPAEIELALAASPGVQHAIVIAREDIAGHRRLVAYVVPKQGQQLDPEALRRFLAKRLPSYMLPSVFVVLERLPLSINGKVDRSALPEPRPRTHLPDATTDSPLVMTLVKIFAEVLGSLTVDPAVDFLTLGGDSLLGVQVLARIRELLGVELPLASIFEARSAISLAARVENALKTAAPVLPPLRTQPRLRRIPATVTQAKALLISELSGESLPYQSQAAHRIIGPLDIGALERALSAVIKRHEILRTTFERSDGIWTQNVHESTPVRLVIEDLSKQGDPERALDDHLAGACQVRLDPTRLPLARYSIVRLADQHHALVAIEHHVVHDGISTSLFLAELVALYIAEAGQCPSSLPPPKVQYRDFALWQEDLVRSDYGQRTLAYWRERLAGAPPTIELPFDHPRPARQTYRGDTLRLRVSDELASEVGRCARAYDATTYVIMLAVYCALLAGYTTADEVMVGSGLANRRTLASEQLIGMVVNSVALRIDLSGDPTIGVLVERVRAAVIDAQTHQDVPFEHVVESLAPARRTNAAPIYQTLFSFHDAPVRTMSMGSALLVPRDTLPNGSAKADLNVVVIHRRSERFHRPPVGYDCLAEDGLTVVWEYNSDLLERTTAGRMLNEYHSLLEHFVRKSGDCTVRSLRRFDLPKMELVPASFGRKVPYERETTIAEVFEARVAERPLAMALTSDGGTLSYMQLDRRANRLAHRLREWQVTDGMRVGICLERSLDLIICFLAVAKAGAVYVPLDPSEPPGRLHRHVDAVGLRIVLTQARHRKQLPGPPLKLMCIDDGLDLMRHSDAPPARKAGPLDPVYVMFTSGSTGTPHAVEVPHRAVVRLVRSADYVRLEPKETLISLAPPTFDASTFEIWGALLNGGRLALAPPGPIALAELADLIARESVTTLWLTAGLFHRVVDERPELLSSLRQLLAGGDVLSPDHVRRALRALPADGRLINGYGPTEATTFTCVHPMVSGDTAERTVPIGRPIPNASVYLLDAAGDPVPIGTQGELWIGGDGVALGYAGEPVMTAERFRPDPFSPESGARMYRSGDLARWRADGLLEFLGRGDRQLKVRGFRIEPVEIEEALRSHPLVADAYVTAYERTIETRGLAAYFAANTDSVLDTSELRAHVAAILPAYAVPIAWRQMQQLPLTNNGKINVAALPPADMNSLQRAVDGNGNQRAPDRIERQLITIWERALNTDGIGPDDDFFDLGGHSLLAVEVFDAVEQTFGRSLPLSTIFDAPTVRRLATALREEGWHQPRGSLVTLTATGARPPIFFVAAGDGNSVGFGALARRLGDDQPLYALQQRGINGAASLHVTVEQMATHYIRAIKRIRRHGPYLLGGRCLGGFVAYEMARRLETRGEKIALLAVLDSAGPLWRERRLADGTPFDYAMNSALRREQAATATIGDISSAEGTERLFEWLADPILSSAEGLIITRYLFELYQLRTDLRDEFPNIPGADVPRLVEWAWIYRRALHPSAERLLQPLNAPAVPLPSSHPHFRDRAAALAKYLRWRIEEAVDLLTGERLDQAAFRRRERLRTASMMAGTDYRAGPYGGKVTLIRSEEYRQQTFLDHWYGLDTAGIVEREVRGSHRSMLREPDVGSLAECLRNLIDQTLDA